MPTRVTHVTLVTMSRLSRYTTSLHIRPTKDYVSLDNLFSPAHSNGTSSIVKDQLWELIRLQPEDKSYPIQQSQVHTLQVLQNEILVHTE